MPKPWHVAFVFIQHCNLILKFSLSHACSTLSDISLTFPCGSHWWISSDRENRTIKYPDGQEHQQHAFMGDSSMSRHLYLPKMKLVYSPNTWDFLQYNSPVWVNVKCLLLEFYPLYFSCLSKFFRLRVKRPMTWSWLCQQFTKWLEINQFTSLLMSFI